MNNRGEDTVCWWSFDRAGQLRRVGQVELTLFAHPGVAARHFTFDRAGSHLLVADLSGNLVRSYRVGAQGGAVEPRAVTDVPAPAFVLVVDPKPTRRA